MDEFLGFVVVGAIAPFFWLIVLSVCLWIGRKFLSDKAGRILFGHYWHSREQKRIK